LLGKVMKQLPELRALGYFNVTEGCDRVVFFTNGENAEQGEPAYTHSRGQLSKKVVFDPISKNFVLTHTVPFAIKRVRDADDSGNQFKDDECFWWYCLPEDSTKR